jgi:hypothetical protein
VQPPGLTTITLNEANEQTAVDRTFSGNFSEIYVDPGNRILHVRKTDHKYGVWDGPGEFRSALAFDISTIPKQATIDYAYVSVSVANIGDIEHILVDVYGFVGYSNLAPQTEAFMGGTKVAGPIRALGQADFSHSLEAIDVTSFIRQCAEKGYSNIGFSYRQAGNTYSTSVDNTMGTGFTFRSRDFQASGLKPHIVVRLRYTSTLTN